MIEAVIRSANPIIETLFDLCVHFLLRLADLLGISYDTINVWIFCIIWPIFTLTLVFVIVRQHRKIRRLKYELEKIEKAESKTPGTF